MSSVYGFRGLIGFNLNFYLKTMSITPVIKDKGLVTKGTFYAYRSALVSQKTDLTSGQAWNYDIAAVLGATEAAKCDLTKTEIQVYVLDTDVGSATNGYYVDAGAIAAVGFKEDGKVRVVNQHASTQAFMIRVIVYRKPL